MPLVTLLRLSVLDTSLYQSLRCLQPHSHFCRPDCTSCALLQTRGASLLAHSLVACDVFLGLDISSLLVQAQQLSCPGRLSAHTSFKQHTLLPLGVLLATIAGAF